MKIFEDNNFGGYALIELMVVIHLIGKKPVQPTVWLTDIT